MNDQNKTDRMRVMTYLAQGVLPFEQWSCVFFNPRQYGQGHDGTRSKAFSVWFPTMIDYISGKSKVQAEISRLSRDDDCKTLILLCDELERRFIDILSLYSRDEQVYLLDRRNQNVHGSLSLFRIEDIDIKYYSAEDKQIVKIRIPVEEYGEMVKKFYENGPSCELRLLAKEDAIPIFEEFVDFYKSQLKFEPHIIKLAQELGVA